MKWADFYIVLSILLAGSAQQYILPAALLTTPCAVFNTIKRQLFLSHYPSLTSGWNMFHTMSPRGINQVIISGLACACNDQYIMVPGNIASTNHAW